MAVFVVRGVADADFATEMMEATFKFNGGGTCFLLRREAPDRAIYLVTVAHALGEFDTEKRIATFVATVLADESIPEDDRAGVLLYSGNAAFMKKVGMRLFTKGMGKLHEEFEAATIENLRAALKQFPTSSMIYTGLAAVAQRSIGERQKELATEIINAWCAAGRE